MSISPMKKLVLVSAMALLSSCASAGQNPHTDAEADPLESINRPIFEFNYQADKYVIKPVAKGYRAITTPFVRDRIRSALANLMEPVSAGNYILQGEPVDSAKSLSRFVINSTLGLAGMFDVAEGWGLPCKRATFNETFAKWCIPQGPYLVLPLIGPSTPRAAAGLALEFVFDPVYWATYNDANVHDKASWGYAALLGITAREQAIELLDDLESNSVDFYATMRSAYLQNQSKLRCYRDQSEPAEAYDFDFGIEDEDMTFDQMEQQ